MGKSNQITILGEGGLEYVANSRAQLFPIRILIIEFLRQQECSQKITYWQITDEAFCLDI